MTIFYYYRSLKGWAPCKADDDAILTGSGESKLDETHTRPVKLNSAEAELSLHELERKYPAPAELVEPKIKLV